MQSTKRQQWMSLPLWQTLQQIEPNPQAATGPGGQTVVLMGQGVAVSSIRGVQDAVELMQTQSGGRVSP